MNVKQEFNPTFMFTLPHTFIAASSEVSEKLTLIKSHPNARGRYRHNGLRMNTAQDFTDITYQHICMVLFLMLKLILKK